MPSELFPEEQEDFPLFLTEVRTLTYEGNFSIRLTEKEMNAYRIQVTVNPYYVPVRRYTNKEYNPERTVFYRYTAWSQDVGVVRDGLIQYPSVVILDYRNEGMLTRWWNAALWWLSANLEGSRFAVLGQALTNVIPGFNLIWNIAVLRWSQEFNDYFISTTLPSDTAPGAVPKLRIPGFTAPETMWKFVQDAEGMWAQVSVKIWYFGEIPALPIELPTPEDEEPESSPDSQAPQPSGLGEPPLPEDQSPLDPRNDPDDYTSAEPEEPDDPGEVTPNILAIEGLYGIEFPSGTRANGPTGQQTFCEGRSQPPPQIRSSTNIDGIPGNAGWQYEFTDLGGTRQVRTVGTTGSGATPFGSPQIVLTPC